MSDTEKTRTVSVRFPKELLAWIDSYSRIRSINDKLFLSRNSIIINFLETMKSIIEYREETEWHQSHIDEINDVLDKARKEHQSRQAGM